MKFNPLFLSSAAVITLSCMVTAAAYYYRSRNKEINDVMVFCKLQFNAWNCFDKLISYIEAAKKSVNVCMPSIHNPAIQGKLVQLLIEKNIKVRIIIDRNGYNDSTDFFLKELVEAGAEIKCRIKEPYNMHHKFCLIDDKVLMTGTLNWGDDRSGEAWNYVYVTNKARLVEPVKQEFKKMWSVDMVLEEALKIESEEESDADTTEIELNADEENDLLKSKPQDLNNMSGIHSEPFQIPFIEDTLSTPEVCIM